MAVLGLPSPCDSLVVLGVMKELCWGNVLASGSQQALGESWCHILLDRPSRPELVA